jgi:hypothetical protein
LTLHEYDHYQDLLEDKADSQDKELAARLAQAAAKPNGGERQPFSSYLHQRRAPRGHLWLAHHA